MSKLFPNLFTPLKLGHKTLKNRVTFGAHTSNMAEAGLPGERHLGYYLERAKGGAAMIVVEPVPVHRTGVLTRGNFRHEDDSIIPHFRTITEACKAQGTVMIQQLYHVGQHGDWDNAFEAAWSPSGRPSYHDSDGSHALSEMEIEELITAFVEAARRAHDSGFDGVELFAAYHALIDQFWTPWSNQRDDRWGGSFDNRMRFSTEIMSRIRRTVGDDFIIGLAISHDGETEVALSLEALQEIVAYHDSRGLMDYVTCGTGSYFRFWKLIPTALEADRLGAPAAEALKQVARHARVQAESHIRTPEGAETVLSSGQADLVSIVRGQIADPHWAVKAAADRPEAVRPCLSCNQMCWGRRYRDYWISCVVNPSSGREFRWGGERPEKSDYPRRLLVVGGGPAGLEAARMAAERGHEVILAEASGHLGGRFRLAGLQPRRAQILDLIEWYQGRLDALGVEVWLNSPLEAEEVLEAEPEVVVVATGAQPDGAGFQRALPQLERLPGIEDGQVYPVEDVMGRACRPGNRVVLLDDIGHWEGPGTAWYLAEKGHQVALVTPHPMAAWELQRTAADWPLRQRLKSLGVVTYSDSAILEWHGNAATILDLADGTRSRLEADTLVLATCNRPETDLFEELREEGLDVRAIGDCLAPRRAHSAIFEGRRLALEL